MWFTNLTGIEERSAADVRSQLELREDGLFSKANGRTFQVGKLETPTLAELRERGPALPQAGNSLTICEVVADVQQLHADAAHAGALFQAASQFNLLEMVSPAVTPDDGLNRYSDDKTQGPACAIAAGAGTIFRNYLVPLGKQTGQSAELQIDCLDQLGHLLDNPAKGFWTVRNGYALATAAGLEAISAHLGGCTETERETLRGALRIGLQWDTQVTLPGCSHLVHQAYCSAMPVAYSHLSAAHWRPFATLILEALYEATLYAGWQNFCKNGHREVFLTLVGGGAFGNPYAWIFLALRRALEKFAHVPLDLKIVSYGQAKPEVGRFVREF